MVALVQPAKATLTTYLCRGPVDLPIACGGCNAHQQYMVPLICASVFGQCVCTSTGWTQAGAQGPRDVAEELWPPACAGGLWILPLSVGGASAPAVPGFSMCAAVFDRCFLRASTDQTQAGGLLASTSGRGPLTTCLCVAVSCGFLHCRCNVHHVKVDGFGLGLGWSCWWQQQDNSPSVRRY